MDTAKFRKESIQQKIEAIEKEIRETPYHKGTQRHIGNLRGRLAKLRHKLHGSSFNGKAGQGFAVSKSGDATVVLVGPPSVGKSTLLNKLTNAKSPVADYEFTTLKVIPGMLKYNGANIQILDIPGLVTGAAKGVGRGKEILSAARIADAVILMTDVERVDMLEDMENELEEAGISIKQFSIIKVINKLDIGNWKVGIGNLEDVLEISAKKGIGLDELREKIWENLGLIRLYLKDNHGNIDCEDPLIVKEGTTVYKAAEQLSGELAEELKGAKIWGKKAKHPGQIVSLDQELFDEAVVNFVS